VHAACAVDSDDGLIGKDYPPQVERCLQALSTSSLKEVCVCVRALTCVHVCTPARPCALPCRPAREPCCPSKDTCYKALLSFEGHLLSDQGGFAGRVGGS